MLILNSWRFINGGFSLTNARDKWNWGRLWWGGLLKCFFFFKSLHFPFLVSKQLRKMDPNSPKLSSFSCITVLDSPLISLNTSRHYSLPFTPQCRLEFITWCAFLRKQILLASPTRSRFLRRVVFLWGGGNTTPLKNDCELVLYFLFLGVNQRIILCAPFFHFVFNQNYDWPLLGVIVLFKERRLSLIGL